ncbi:Tectonic-2 [Sparganum proliferum]
MVDCSTSDIAGVSFVQNPLSVQTGRQNDQTTVVLNSLTGQASLQCQAASIVGTKTEISASNLSLQIFPNGGVVASNSFSITLYANFKFAGIFLKCGATLSQPTSNLSASAGTSCMSNLTQSTTGVYWLVTPSLIQLTSSFFQLNVSRSAYPSWKDIGQSEDVTVVCCNQDTTGVAPGLSATATFTVRLRNMWLNSTSAATDKTEVTLPNPAFTNVAPCPCDLTEKLCDAGCCCDQDCSEYQPMPCISGPHGGETPTMDPSSCWIKTVAALSTLNYHPALCIFFNNTAALGLFYDQVPLVSTLQDFSSKASSTASNLQVQPSTTDQGSRGYSQVSGTELALGSPIRLCLVRYDMLSGDLGTDPSCQLTGQPLQLPAASFSSRLDPVKYLEDFNTYGEPSPIRMTSEICSNAGNLNLIPGQGPTASPTDGSRLNAISYLLSDPATDRICPPFFRVVANQTSTVTTLPVIANYFCLSQSEIIAAGYLQEPNGTTTNSGADSRTGFLQQSCSYNATSGQASCSPDTSVNSTAFPPSLCSWDNGEVVPPKPNLIGNLCENVVLTVSYRFILTAGSLSQLVVDMHLGAVDVTSSNILFQRFRTSFVPSSQAAADTGNILGYRSGINGYERGLPLVLGRYSNSFVSDAFFVKIKASRGMSSSIGVPIPGADNLCSPTATRPIIFGGDVHASCLLKLAVADFRDCQQLRPNSSFVLDSPKEINSTDFPPAQCPRIPAGVQLLFFFTKLRSAGGGLLEQIIGAQLSYDLVNWRIDCSSGDLDSACISMSNATSSFTLSTTVTFTEVPQDWPERLRFARDPVDPSSCRRQACWRDTFDPWRQVDLEEGELADLVRARRIAISVTLVGIGFLSLFLFRPLK